MDPDTCRAKILELANQVLHTQGGAGELLELSDQLAEAVHDLDVWLRAGGFLPTAWATRLDSNHGRHQEV